MCATELPIPIALNNLPLCPPPHCDSQSKEHDAIQTLNGCYGREVRAVLKGRAASARYQQAARVEEGALQLKCKLLEAAESERNHEVDELLDVARGEATGYHQQTVAIWAEARRRRRHVQACLAHAYIRLFLVFLQFCFGLFFITFKLAFLVHIFTPKCIFFCFNMFLILGRMIKVKVQRKSTQLYTG